MFTKIRGVLMLIQFAITISIVIIAMFLFRKHTHKIRQIWARLQIKLMGANLIIKGELDPNAQMVLLNHQSILDIVVMESIHPNNLAWVAKKEIAKIPWFGLILDLPEMITVERESKASLVKLLKDAKQRIQDKRPIAIFPEGTRTDGSKLRKFKMGGKLIAEKNDLLVQPVVLVGTRKIFDSQNITQQSGDIHIVFLPSIQASKQSNWYEECENKMDETLKKELQYDI